MVVARAVFADAILGQAKLGSLVRLAVTCRRIDADAVSLLFSVLLRLPGLQQLDLRRCEVSAEQKAAVAVRLQQHQSKHGGDKVCIFRE
jgi:hypothetical protein